MLETLMIPSSIVSVGTRRRSSGENEATDVPARETAEFLASGPVADLFRHNMPGKRCRIGSGR